MKKLLIIMSVGFATVVSLSIMTLSLLLFYVDSDHFSTLALQQINSRIPGTMEWKEFKLSLLKGEIFLKGYRLTMDGEELAGFDQVHISLDFFKIKTA